MNHIMTTVFLSRVQHLRGSHLHLQSGLHDPGVSVFDWIMYWQRQRKRLPPQTCWHVFRICRWVRLTNQMLQFGMQKPHFAFKGTSCDESTGMLRPDSCSHTSRLSRSLFLHLTGGDASISQAHDRERGHNLDRILLRLVLRLCLHRLCPPLSHWHRPPRPLHAPDAQESVGDLHGRRAGASGVTARQTDDYRMRLMVSFVLSTGVRLISRTRADHNRDKVMMTETGSGVDGPQP